MSYKVGEKVRILQPAEGAEYYTKDWVGRIGTVEVAGIVNYYIKGPHDEGGGCWWFRRDQIGPGDEDDLPE